MWLHPPRPISKTDAALGELLTDGAGLLSVSDTVMIDGERQRDRAKHFLDNPLWRNNWPRMRQGACAKQEFFGYCC